VLREVTSGTPLATSQGSANTTVGIAAAQVSTLAGNGQATDVDGPGAQASMNDPSGMVTVGGYGYVLAIGALDRIDLHTGAVTTLAGDGSAWQGFGSTNSSNPADVTFPAQSPLATDGSFIYSAGRDDYCSYSVRRTSISTGATSTLTTSDLPSIDGLTVGPDGYIYTTSGGACFGDQGSYMSGANDIYRIDPVTGTTTLFTTDTQAVADFGITADSQYLWVTGQPQNCSFSCPSDNQTLNRISLATGASTVFDSNVGSDQSPSYGSYNAITSAGDYLYTDDTSSSEVRVYDKNTGLFTVIAGSTTSGNADGYPGAFGTVRQIASDGSNLYVTDLSNHTVRVLAPFTAGGPTLSDLIGGYNLSEATTTCSCKDPVNTATGSFWSTLTDLSVTGEGPGIEMTRSYDSSQAGVSGPLGPGWRFGYQMHLRLDPADPSGSTLADAPELDVVQENGAVDSFAQADGGYEPPTRVFASLTHNSDGTWTFVRRRTQTFTFTASGVLSAISDTNGLTTSFAYNGSGQLSTATDAAGRTLSFSYSGGLLGSVTDSAGRAVGYGYDGSGRLASVTDPTGNVTHYSYDGANRLTVITDPRGHSLTNTYNSDSDVSSQTDYRGHTTTFSYSTPSAPGVSGGFVLWVSRSR
jgi:YD repeat-containing protein